MCVTYEIKIVKMFTKIGFNQNLYIFASIEVAQLILFIKHLWVQDI